MAAKGGSEVAKKPAVVIGEGMKDRVIPTAKEAGKAPYKPRGEWTTAKQERWAKDRVWGLDCPILPIRAAPPECFGMESSGSA